MNETTFPPVGHSPESPTPARMWMSGFLKILYAPAQVGRMVITSPMRPVLFGILLAALATLASEVIMTTNPTLVKQQVTMADNDIRALGRVGKSDEETINKEIQKNRQKTQQNIPWPFSVLRSLAYGFVSVFAVGLLLWFLQRLFNAEPPPVLSIVAIVAYGFSIDSIDAIARAVMMAVTGSVFATPSLAFLVAPSSTALGLIYTLLSKLNIFTVWEYIALGLAVSAHVGMPRKFGVLFGTATFLIVYGAIATVAMIYTSLLSTH